MIEVNYLVVGLCTIVAMVLGAVWYGPLFGKQWMRLNGVDPNDQVAVKAMQKGVWVTMFIQLISTFFLVWVLFIYLKAAADEMTQMSNALWIYAGFIVPTLVSTVIWTNELAHNKRTRFLIQAGYNLVIFAIFGYVISMWG